MLRQTTSSTSTGERRAIGMKRTIPITEEIYQVGGQSLTAAEDAAIYAIVLPEHAALIDAGFGEGTERLLGRKYCKPLLMLFLPLLIGAAALPVRAEDTRQRVELPPPMQAHMLANMRDHLVALETITRQLAEDQYESAAETAEGRLGMSAMQAHGAAHMAPFMPEAMRTIGTTMHHAASRFAVAAHDAEVSGDLGAAFGALSQVMQQCVACHEGFRVR